MPCSLVGVKTPFHGLTGLCSGIFGFTFVQSSARAVRICDCNGLCLRIYLSLSGQLPRCGCGSELVTRSIKPMASVSVGEGNRAKGSRFLNHFGHETTSLVGPTVGSQLEAPQSRCVAEHTHGMQAGIYQRREWKHMQEKKTKCTTDSHDNIGTIALHASRPNHNHAKPKRTTGYNDGIATIAFFL